jgi:lipoprotein
MKKYTIHFITILVLLFVYSCQNDPEPLQYQGFEVSSNTNEYYGEKGLSVNVKAKVTAENGIKDIYVTIGAWKDGDSEIQDMISVKGSPKIYDLSYVVTIPEDAVSRNNIVAFVIEDYQGVRKEYKVTVFAKDDLEEPTMVIDRPLDGQSFTPMDELQFKIMVTDNLKMGDVTITCEEISFSKTYAPSPSDPSSITIDDQLALNDLSGEYTFTITATDAQNNSVTETRKIGVKIPSKPSVYKSMDHEICGVSGGTIKFNFDIVTNYEHQITEVKLACSDLGIDKTYNPNASEYKLEAEFDVASDKVYTRNIPVKITATNNSGEVTEWEGECHIIKDVFIIGKGTLAREKEGYAIPMQQNSSTPNEFEAITWIENVGDGFKFLSAKSWNDFNWGLNNKNELVSADSEFIKPSTAGYYKLTFNPVDWTYTATKYTVNEDPKHSEMYIFGHRFKYKDATGWKDLNNWNDPMVKMTRYPTNPHRFYLDIMTGPAQINGNWERRAIFKFAAQNNFNDGGSYYGIKDTSDDKWVWWEYSGPIYQFTKAGEAPNLVEDSRSDAEMRIVIDTYLMYMSWMPLDQY